MSDSRTPIRFDALFSDGMASIPLVIRGTLRLKALDLLTRLFLRRELAMVSWWPCGIPLSADKLLVVLLLFGATNDE
jgi:hypothetical protein